MSESMIPFRITRPHTRFKASPGGLNRKLWAPGEGPKETNPDAESPREHTNRPTR